jgi:cytochrome P450
MGWDEWNVVLIPQGKVHSEGRLLVRKATSREAVASYRPLIEANNNLFLKNALGMTGDPLPLVYQ